MESFREYVSAGAFGNTATTGYGSNFWGTGRSLADLPVPTLDIPTKRLEGRIRSIFYTQNPISIVLEDGSTWKVNKDQWNYLKSINKEPLIGKLAQIEMFLDGTIRSVNFA